MSNNLKTTSHKTNCMVCNNSEYHDGNLLVASAKANNFAEVNRLLNSGLAVSAANYCGLTVLHYACENGNKQMVETLIARGANLNVRSVFNDIPLQQAYYSGHYSIITMLIEAGADLNIQGHGSSTILQSIIKAKKIYN